jgi:ribonucleoside-triphosphate reductase
MLTAIVLQSNQNEQHGGQSVPNFDYALSLGIKKSFLKNVVRNMKRLRYFDSNIVPQEVDRKVASQINISDPPSTIYEKFFNVPCDASKINSFEIVCKLSIEDTIEQTEQAMEALVHNLNSMHSRAGSQVPFTSINFGTDVSEEGRIVSRALLNSMWNGLGAGETPMFPILVFKVKDGVNYNPCDKNYDLFKLAMKVSAKRMYPNFVFIDAPFNLKYYKPNCPSSEVATMGCRTRVIGSIFPESDGNVFGRGNLSFTTINLPRIGLNNFWNCTMGGGYVHNKELLSLIKHRITFPLSEENEYVENLLPKTKYPKFTNSIYHYSIDKIGIIEEALYEDMFDNLINDLKSKLELVAEELLDRFRNQYTKHVKNFPFLIGQGIWFNSFSKKPFSETENLYELLKHGTLSIGFIGLAECMKAVYPNDVYQSQKVQKKALEIIGFMRKTCDELSSKYQLNFTLLATPAEGLSGKFTQKDVKMYGLIKNITNRKFYTNSFHVPVYEKVNVLEKIRVEASYHELCNAGAITYIELDGNVTNNLKAFESVIRLMKENGVGYGAINHPIDRDPVCKYEGVIDNECPKCKRKEGNIKFDRIRRITGYLVGTMDMWNNAKKAEEAERVKHTMSEIV